MKRQIAGSGKRNLFVIALLVSSISIGAWVTVQATPTSVVEPGSMATEASYIVFKDGSTYYARNGKTGDIDYSGANAASVIQSAINALTGARTWKERVVIKGDFSTDSTITVPSYTILELDGKLTLANSSNCTMIANSDSVNGNTDIEIIGGEIDGNGTNQSGGCGISFNKVSYGRIDGVVVSNPYDVGIYAVNSTAITVSNCEVTPTGEGSTSFGINFFLSDKCKAISNYVDGGSAGIVLNSTSGVQHYDNIIKANTCVNQTGAADAAGITIYGQDRFIVEGNTCRDASYYGIIARESRFGVISDNATYSNSYNGIKTRGKTAEGTFYTQDIIIANNSSVDDNYAGIVVDGDYRISIIGNYCYSCDTGSGIIVYSPNCLVSDNYCYYNQHSGIVLNGGADYTIVEGNYCLQNNQEIGYGGAGIFLRSGTTYNQVIGNTCKGNRRYGIMEESSTANYNVIARNHASGSSYGQIVKAGANTIVQCNQGFVTENSGTATIANGTSSIQTAHGLSGTPTAVTVTGRHEETRDLIISARDGTNITISTGDGANVTADRTVDWKAIYKP